MALDLGSLVMVLSKVGTITNPELMFAVVSLVVSELSPRAGGVIRPNAIVISCCSVEAGNDVIGDIPDIKIPISAHTGIK